jgi:hypothetical protein
LFVFHHTNCHVIESDRTLTTRIIPSRRSRRPNPEFIEIVAALWPERDDWHSLACADAMGWYVALYTRDMLNARDEGVIAEAYRVEDTPPCAVAKMSGLLQRSERAAARCDAYWASVAASGEEGAPTRKGRNRRNRDGIVRLSMRDVKSEELRALVTDVANRSGYAL